MSARSVPSSQRTTASRKLAIITPTPMAADTAIISAAMATAVRESAAAILSRLGLYDRRHQLADGLTLPDRKRLEVARALATEPKLLLLDEVMAGLRPTEVDVMVRFLRELSHSTGLTILLIEHVMRAVMALAAEVVVVSYGEKIAQGTPQEIARHQAVLDVYLGEQEVL